MAGTGTELEKRDVPMVDGAWTGAACGTHPDIVREVHQAYIEAGAELIIANTYSSSRHLLANAGLDTQFETLNRVGIQLAIEARSKTNVPETVVAGSISTTHMFLGHPPVEVARKNYTDQALIQKDAGAEMIILEMLRDTVHTDIVVEASLATGLPVWAGFSCFIRDEGVILFDETETLEAGIKGIRDKPIELVAIMHTLTEDIDACLDVVQAHWDGPIGVYAHSGDFIPPKWQFIDMISPEAYADACLRWVKRGVQVIGGCCGIGPEHIRVLKERLPTHID